MLTRSMVLPTQDPQARAAWRALLPAPAVKEALASEPDSVSRDDQHVVGILFGRDGGDDAVARRVEHGEAAPDRVGDDDVAPVGCDGEAMRIALHRHVGSQRGP